ncbi:MAG: hypothetical protein WCS31_08295 [Verrucomicrobiae bacterium]
MKAKTELLLYHLLWTTEALFRPTFRNLNQSFEGWAYKNGFLPQIHRLEAQGFLEANRSALDRSRFVRLTEAGRVAALGGRDPEQAWSVPWDGKWRLFLFDIPVTDQALRKQIHRALADCGCGCLQGSVWISPHLPAGTGRFFAERGEDCSHLMMLESGSRGMQVDARMVQAAWSFPRINERYQQHIEILDRLPVPARYSSRALLDRALLDWSKLENQAWLDAVRRDPLLPSALLPTDYLGTKAWKKRRAVLPRAMRLLAQHQEK